MEEKKSPRFFQEVAKLTCCGMPKWLANEKYFGPQTLENAYFSYVKGHFVCVTGQQKKCEQR